MTCLYCGGTELKPLHRDVKDRLGHVSGTWSFLECVLCRSAVLSPFPNTRDIEGFYPPVYDFSFQSHSNIGRVLRKLEYLLFFKPQYQVQCRALLRFIGASVTKSLSLLDAGCGKGIRLSIFREAGFHVFGSDISVVSTDYAKQLQDVSVSKCSIDTLEENFGPNRFDVLTSFYTIEHVPSVETSLKSMWAVLKPGGVLLLATLLNESFQSKFWGAKWEGVTEAPRHLTIPSTRGLRIALQKNNFSDICFTPDSVLNCAGVWLLSLFPSLGVRHSGKGRRRLGRTAPASIVAVLILTPLILWCFVENYILRRPALVLVFAKKSGNP